MGYFNWGGRGPDRTLFFIFAVLSQLSSKSNPVHCAPVSVSIVPGSNLPTQNSDIPLSTTTVAAVTPASPVLSSLSSNANNPLREWTGNVEEPIVPRESYQMAPAPAPPKAPTILDNIQSQREEVQAVILRTQKDLLRLIGLIDRSWESFGESLRNTTFHFFLDTQKAFGKAYHATPQFVNRFIQRIGTAFGPTGDQANQVFNTYRTNLKSFIDNWEEHEYDQRFKDINANLGVSPLPHYNFQWA